jgi:outer membrane protein assembly factor BamB
VALGFDGDVRWTRSTFGRMYEAPVLAPNGDILFRDATNKFGTYWMKRLRPDGTTRWQKGSDPDYSSPAFAPDVTFYWGRFTNITLAAFTPEGDEKWRLGRPERALSTPVVGPDGTIYFTARRADENVLMAVDSEGNVKWSLPLDWGHALKSPVVDANGRIYLVTGDRFVRAIAPDGKMIWKYRVPGKLEWRGAVTWKNGLRQFRQRFGLRKDQQYGMPLISSEGILYVNFAHTGSLYAFDLN